MTREELLAQVAALEWVLEFVNEPMRIYAIEPMHAREYRYVAYAEICRRIAELRAQAEKADSATSRVIDTLVRCSAPDGKGSSLGCPRDPPCKGLCEAGRSDRAAPSKPTVAAMPAPVAYRVYVAAHDNQYFTENVEETVDDVTNHGAVVTPLYER